MNGVELAKSVFELKKEFFENYKSYAALIKKILKEILKDELIKVIVFGSVPKKKYTPLSDLDVLVVVKNAHKLKYGDIVEEIEKRLKKKLVGIEIHLASQEEFENWYKKFLDFYEEV